MEIPRRNPLSNVVPPRIVCLSRLTSVPGCEQRFIKALSMAKLMEQALITRVQRLQKVFAEIDPAPLDKWLDDFSHDLHPEREILIWEAMASAYSSFVRNRNLSIKAKEEASRLLLLHSLMVKESLIIRSRQYLTREEAKELLGLYPRS